MPKVKAVIKDGPHTGTVQYIPAHWVDIPILFDRFRLAPSNRALREQAEQNAENGITDGLAADTATTPETPAKSRRGRSTADTTSATNETPHDGDTPKE